MNNLDEKVSRLEVMLREQQTEIASLREALARKNRSASSAIVPSAPAPTLAEPPHPQKPDTTRRKMLKRMGLAVLAGGAALGITAATYAPAEAKLSVNPGSNVGAVITRNGASITNVPTDTNFGLVVSADGGTLDTTGILYSGYSTGVTGLSDADENSIGVYGYSYGGTGVFGSSIGGTGMSSASTSGTGIYGTSSTGIGIYGHSGGGPGIRGETSAVAQPAINAKNNGSTSGIALQIEQGGFTVKGAGTGTKTAAFIHQTSSTNIPVSPNNYRSKIDNPLCNGQSGALLLVTHITSSGPAETNPFGVYYDGSFWYISHENTSIAMSQNLYFNVLIINP